MHVKVRFVDIASMEGLYGRGDQEAVIWLSALRPLPRRNYSCAHELGHHVFGHGAAIDEFVEATVQKPTKFRPEEFTADVFAGFILMPALGVRQAFAIRGWKAANPKPLELFTVACHFGVGYDTLVGHLEYTLRAITSASAEELRKASPKLIRERLLGREEPRPLIIADQYWAAPTVDAEVGTVLLLPKDAEAADELTIAPQFDHPQGKVFRATRAGIVRVACPSSTWSTFVRIAPIEFTGFAEYRHLAREDGDE
jgi:hypothetical protein